MTTHHHHPPRPLHLISPVQQITTTPTNDLLSTPPPPPSSLRNPKRFSLATSSPSTSTSAITPRRQSSISYFPPDSTDGPRRGALPRRNSLGVLNGWVAPRQVAAEGTQTRRRAGAVPLPATSTSVPGTPAPRERPPLTLTEKHADLLHFIAQKESKCLELRSQLVIHEAELLQLKRKWERIVNRGLECGLNPATSLSNDTTAPSHSEVVPGPAVLEGLREGMQEMSRFFAAGFSMADPKTSPASTPHTKPCPIPVSTPKHKPPSLSPSTRRSHLARESDSSISTYATKSTTRFSQSSVSSFGEEFVYASPSDQEEIQEDDEDSSDNAQVLMVRDTGATPTMSPNPEFHKQKYRKQRSKSHQSRPCPISPQDGTAERGKGELDLCVEGETWSSSVKAIKAHRRRSRDASMRLDPEHMDFSTLSPSALLSPPLRGANASPSPRSASPSFLPLDGTRKEVVADSTSKRSNLNSNGVGGLPPMASIPGLGSFAAGAVSPPPVSSWMDSVGKKLGQLQRSSTFTKSQKRASLLLADVSQSIVSVLTSPPPSTVAGASTTSASVVRTPSVTMSSPASPNPSPSPTSLLDDDEDTVRLDTALLVPAKTHKQTQPGASPGMSEMSLPRDVARTLKQTGDDDDDEWNW